MKSISSIVSGVALLLCLAGATVKAQMPTFSSPEEKSAWIRSHRDEYQRMLDQQGKGASATQERPEPNKASTSEPAKAGQSLTAVGHKPVVEDRQLSVEEKKAYHQQLEQERQAKERAEKEAYNREVANEKAQADAAEKAEKAKQLSNEEPQPKLIKADVTAEQYNASSPEKKAYIDSHPEQYNIINK